METKALITRIITLTLIAIAVKVYSPQPSNLSDILNDSTNHFFKQS